MILLRTFGHRLRLAGVSGVILSFVLGVAKAEEPTPRAFNYADILPVVRAEEGARNTPGKNLLGEVTPAKRWNDIEAHDYRKHLDYLSADLAERVLDEDLDFLRKWAPLGTEERYRWIEGEALFYLGHYNQFEYSGIGVVPWLYFGQSVGMGKPVGLPLDPDGHRLLSMLAVGGGESPSNPAIKRVMEDIARKNSLAGIEKASAISLRHPAFFEARTLNLAYAAFTYGGQVHPIVSVAARARQNPLASRPRFGPPEGREPPHVGAPGSPPPGMGNPQGMPMPPDRGPPGMPSMDEMMEESHLDMTGQKKALMNAPVFAPRRDLIDADLALLLLSDSIRHDPRPDVRPLLIAAAAQAPTMLHTYLRPTPEQVAKLTGYVARPWSPPPPPPAVASEGASERSQRMRAERAAGIRMRWWARKTSGPEGAPGGAPYSEATAAVAVASTLALFKIEAEDAAGNTPLLLAARESDEVSVAFLLANGADPQRVNREGDTVLHLAARNPNPSPLYTLLKALPAYVRRSLLLAQNQTGKTPIEEAEQRVLESNKTTRGSDPRTVTRSSLWYIHQVLFLDQLELDGITVGKAREGSAAPAPENKVQAGFPPVGASKLTLPKGRYIGVDPSTGLLWFKTGEGSGFESFDVKRVYAMQGGAEDLMTQLAPEITGQTEGALATLPAGRVNPSDYLVRLTRKDPGMEKPVVVPLSVHPFVWSRKNAPNFVGVFQGAIGGMGEFLLPSGQKHSLRLADLAEDQTGKLAPAKEMAGALPASPFFWRVESGAGDTAAKRARTFSARFIRMDERAVVVPQLPAGVAAPPPEKVAIFSVIKTGSPDVQSEEEGVALNELDAKSRQKAEQLAALMEEFYIKTQGKSAPSAGPGKIEGTLIGLVGSDVFIKNAAGKIEAVPYFDLSDSDGARVRELSRKLNGQLVASLKNAIQMESMRR